MAASIVRICCRSFFVCFSKKHLILSSHLSTSPVVFQASDKKWKNRNDPLGLTPSPAYCRPYEMIDTPDWSYIDGTPGPLGYRQKERKLKQIQYAMKIESLLKEVDFAVERYEKNKDAEAKNRQLILENKLKEKGELKK